MVEFLSNISLLIGIILEQAAHTFIACVIGLGFFYLIKKSPDSACHGNCNQGRNCSCKEKQHGI